MPTILFCWELGRGSGHLANIRRIAARLKTRGFRIIAAVPDPTAATRLAGSCDEIIQVPLWPERHAGPAGASSATLGDILSARGLADRATLHRLLVSWQHIFQTLRPDLIIGDLAPAASLAARGRIPVLLVGNGYTLPPADLAQFPLLHDLAVPRWSEIETLSAVNDVLCAIGQTKLTYLPQLFAADARSVQTFALLDPYDLERAEPVDGPIFDSAPIARRPEAHDIFVYLSGGYAVPNGAVRALAALGNRVHIHAPGLSASQEAALARACVTLHVDPTPLAEALASSRLVIHRGGGGVAAAALAAGTPQLILCAQIEQELTGRALQRAGVGQWVRTYDPAVDISAQMIDDMLADDEMSCRAAEFGELHRNFIDSSDPIRQCESACLALLHRQ